MASKNRNNAARAREQQRRAQQRKRASGATKSSVSNAAKQPVVEALPSHDGEPSAEETPAKTGTKTVVPAGVLPPETMDTLASSEGDSEEQSRTFDGFDRVKIPKTNTPRFVDYASLREAGDSVAEELTESHTAPHGENNDEESDEPDSSRSSNEEEDNGADDGSAGELSTSGSDYFDDDLAILNRGEDEVVAVRKEAGLLKQLDNVVSWELANFYDDEGRRRSKLNLASDPPLFRIESSSGDFAEFVLTRNLALSLSEVFTDVKRGFHGIDPKRSHSLTQGAAPSKIEEVQEWISNNRTKAIIALVLIVLFIGAAFLA